MINLGEAGQKRKKERKKSKVREMNKGGKRKQGREGGI